MLPFFRETYFNDPYNYFLMWNSGILDPKPMVQAVEKQVFSIILFAYNDNPYRIPGMYPIVSGPGTARVLKALLENYRLSKVGASCISRDSISLTPKIRLRRVLDALQGLLLGPPC